ncbi:hypothetical protein V8B55DRAFT_1570222 [Mucor lusitanicus]|uniref:Uncharacterized protein n=2 Tax=Mucor circinelloides f. lusitanicus TaxID=29924 RepID=A0A162QR10_MUCCL|nr:hypothetical protein MUCCIDRAFT_112962 [Mucor lusitanicus CBS 277.49]
MDNILDYIDTKKFEIKDKKSEKYCLLRAIETMIYNIDKYKKEATLTETYHLRAFCNIVDPILQNTRLNLKEGENVSKATQRMQLVNDADVTYGRRIDVLVACESIVDSGNVELASIEFKKSDCSITILRQQQNKNLRINACILNDIHLATKSDAAKVIYLDCAGKSSYLVQLSRFNNCFVGYKIGRVRFIASLFELRQLKESIINIYAWRESMIDVSNQIAIVQAQQSFDYDMIEISDFATSSDSSTTTKRKILPVNIFLSPSNRTKRTKSVLHQ